MCGICASINSDTSVSDCITMLVNMESRGTDATGISYPANGRIFTLKKAVEPKKFRKIVNKVKKNLPNSVGEHSLICIGHNRKANTNLPEKDKDREAHPFISEDGEFSLVHNGSVPAYATIREVLQLHGHRFTSGVDSEVYVHMLEAILREEKEKPLHTTLEKFINYITGNVIILFKDSRIIGIPRKDFRVLKNGKGILIASETDAFEGLASIGSEIFIPKKDAIIEIHTTKKEKHKISFFGDWIRSPYMTKSWLFDRVCMCDFCKTSEIACERFRKDSKDIIRDRCLKCSKDGITELPKEKQYASRSAAYPYGREGRPAQSDDEYWNNYDPQTGVSRTVKTPLLQDIASDTSNGVCDVCKNPYTTPNLLYCGLCRTLYCEACFNLSTHRCITVKERSKLNNRMIV